MLTEPQKHEQGANTKGTSRLRSGQRETSDISKWK